MNHSDAIAGVRDGYDRWAPIYDHDSNPLTALEEPKVRLAMGDVRGKSVLDLGCGTGRHAAWLAAAGASVTGVDFSAAMLREARRKIRADAVQLVEHDLRRPLPFSNGTFDRVVSGLVLEHIPDLHGLFREARRVSVPEGRAVVSAMHPAMFLRGSQARFTDPTSGTVVQPGSIAHPLGDMVMAATAAGFLLEAIHEHSPDEPFATRFPRAEKYVGWPMLVIFELRNPL